MGYSRATKCKGRPSRGCWCSWKQLPKLWLEKTRPSRSSRATQTNLRHREHSTPRRSSHSILGSGGENRIITPPPSASARDRRVPTARPPSRRYHRSDHDRVLPAWRRSATVTLLDRHQARRARKVAKMRYSANLDEPEDYAEQTPEERWQYSLDQDAILGAISR